jgi:hypothetical protein
MMDTGISNRHRGRTRSQRISVMVKISASADERRAADAQRYRPVADEAFLDQLARRLAEVALLPLATARRHVRALAISAGQPLDGGGHTFTIKGRPPRRS